MTSRAEYQKKFSAKVDALNAEVKVLKEKAKQAKRKLDEEIAVLTQKQKVARVRLGEMRTAGDGAWKDVKSAAELAWKDLNTGFAAARKRFK